MKIKTFSRKPKVPKVRRKNIVKKTNIKLKSKNKVIKTLKHQICAKSNDIIKKEDTSILTSSNFHDIKSKQLNPYLIQQLTKEKFITLTPIQAEAIPKLLDGYDILIRSQTGSGKTLAFLVPTIQLLLDTLETEKENFTRSQGSRALILAPTRELVNQTIDLAVRLSIPFPQIVVSSITGGEKRKSEKARLRKGVTLLGSTVGRMCDHLDTTNALKINKLLILILDEADRLLDLGFEKKIRWIVHKLRSIKEGENLFQSVLVSATLNSKIESLANFLLKSDKVIWVGNKSPSDIDIKEELTFPKNLKQYFTEITLKFRLPVLLSVLLSKAESGKTVVFLANCESVEFHHMLCTALRWPKITRKQAQTKKLVVSDDSSSDSDNDHFEKTKFDDKNQTLRKSQKLQDTLSSRVFENYTLYKLHGNLSQIDRTGYLKDFNSKKKNAILFTTDVTARGLNLHNVSWILQVDPPQEVEEYVHRAGRTARLNDEGNALLFLSQHELGYVNYWKDRNVHIEPLSELQLLEPLQQSYLPPELRLNRFQNICSFILKTITRQVEADLDLLQSARRSFTASYRSYRCYSNVFKQYFNPKSLHLGHLASAFGLKESPKLIGEKCRLGVYSKIKKEAYATSKPTNYNKFKKIADGLIHDEKKTSLPVKKNINKLLKHQKLQTSQDKRKNNKIQNISDPFNVDKTVSDAIACMKSKEDIIF